jgi:hypothetical protein
MSKPIEDKSIKPEELETYSERIGAIASAWAYNEGGGREKLFDRMIDHARRGWLSREWVDGAYGAILKGKHLEFHYDPKSNISGWLAGDSPEQVREMLRTVKRKGFKVVRKRAQ